MVTRDNGQVVQNTYYFPYGKGIGNGESYNPGAQPYKFGGKEEEPMFGLGLYDFHERWLNEAVPSFMKPDPLAGKKPWISPYVYCSNNPIGRIDPDGRDDYTVNRKGYIEFLRETEDNTHNIIALGKSNKITYDEDGNMKNKSITVDKSVLDTKSASSVYDPRDKKTHGYDIYQIRGNEQGKQLFEFMAQNTNVEWGKHMTGIAGENGLNFLTTSHDYGIEYGSGDLYNKQLSSYTYRGYNHNHTNGSEIASDGDVGLAKYIQATHPNANFNIYSPGTRRYIKFDSTTPPNTYPEFILIIQKPKK